jgi:hypothetical protein
MDHSPRSGDPHRKVRESLPARRAPRRPRSRGSPTPRSLRGRCRQCRRRRQSGRGSRRRRDRQDRAAPGDERVCFPLSNTIRRRYRVFVVRDNRQQINRKNQCGIPRHRVNCTTRRISPFSSRNGAFWQFRRQTADSLVRRTRVSLRGNPCVTRTCTKIARFCIENCAVPTRVFGWELARSSHRVS